VSSFPIAGICAGDRLFLACAQASPAKVRWLSSFEKYLTGEISMSDEERKLIGSLKQKLADKAIDRCEFLRYTTLLSMAAPTAYM
jgi:hypothetical protein